MGIATLIKDTAGEIVLYIETIGGVPATDLTVSDVSLDLKKSSTTAFFNKVQTASDNAQASIGSGVDGTVTLYSPGTAGNTFSVEVLVPVGTSSLSTALVGSTVTVSLAVLSGVVVAEANTAALIAESISNAWSSGYAEASGTGEDSISLAEGPTALLGGTDGTFTNIGNGFYRVGLDSTDTNTVGTLYLQIRGPQLRPSLESAEVVESIPVAPPTVVVPGTTLITGTVVGMDGSPAANVSVSAKTLSIPTVSGGVGVTTAAVFQRTDDNGQFILKLVTGSQVDIIIPAVNFRRTITVPASSVNLFDMP